MGGYIGATAVGLVTTAADVQGDITSTDTTPELILKNTTETDADGGRDGKITFKGEQSGGEESTLAQIQSSHDGTADDQKGDLIFKTNDGSDGASPTEAMRINSDQNISIPDNGKVMFGTGDDLQIYHNGSNSYVDDAGTGRLYLRGNDRVQIQKYTGEDMITANADGAVNIYYDNSKKFETTATGVEIDGIAMSDSARLSSNSGSSYWDIRRDSSTGHLVVKDDGLGDVLTIEQSAGDFMLHTTNTSLFSATSGNGLLFEPTGVLTVTRETTAATQPLFILNSSGVDCVNILLRKNGDTKGSIGQVNGTPYMANSTTGGIRFGTVSGQTVIIGCDENGASEDNAHDLGASSVRWDDIFATNSTIQTSDENEKQDIASLTSAEITAATAISKLFKTYKWKDKVTAKGNDARTHTGVIAQQVQTAMSNAGLDASKYAFWCSDTWWEKDVEVAAVEANEENDIEAKDAYTRTDQYYTKDEAPEGATEHTRLGVRYPELLAFVGAATEQRLTSIESRLTALEG